VQHHSFGECEVFKHLLAETVTTKEVRASVNAGAIHNIDEEMLTSTDS